MKLSRKILLYLPESYLIVLVLLSGYTPTFSISPISIAIAILIGLQILFKSKIAGLILAGLLISVSLYMIMALISEFNEFPTTNTTSIELLLGGLSLIIINLFVAGIMIYKYRLMVETKKIQNSPIQ